MRKATNTVIELMDAGVLDARAVANACLNYMSEYEVLDMATDNGFIEEDDEDDDDTDDDDDSNDEDRNDDE